MSNPTEVEQIRQIEDQIVALEVRRSLLIQQLYNRVGATETARLLDRPRLWVHRRVTATWLRPKEQQ